jgi:hypothetical protein
MKKTFVFLLTLLIASALPVFAQTADKRIEATKIPADSAAAVATTEQLAAKYQLDAAQKTRMQAVQLRKQRSLAELAPLQATDPALYLQKMKNLQRGTLASIRNILNTREQIALYRKTQSDIRKQRAVKQEEMMAQQASKEALDAALLDIYAE